MATDDNDMPVLSGDTLDALKEFYAERDARIKQLEDLKAGIENENETGNLLSMDAFTEDWNDSQFWYSPDTAFALAEELLQNADSSTIIAAVSAPSVFIQLKNILALDKRSEAEKPRLYLLEYDRRFDVFPEFVFYDFQKPLQLSPSLKGSVDHIICDPPFLSEDCQTKAAMTVRWLSRSWGTRDIDHKSKDIQTAPKLIVCTGERMESLVNKIYKPQRISTTDFEPKHSKGLSNEFYCYANFECQHWKWRTRPI